MDITVTPFVNKKRTNIETVSSTIKRLPKKPHLYLSNIISRSCNHLSNTIQSVKNASGIALKNVFTAFYCKMKNIVSTIVCCVDLDTSPVPSAVFEQFESLTEVVQGMATTYSPLDITPAQTGFNSHFCTVALVQTLS